jgi:hypothetical protein
MPDNPPRRGGGEARALVALLTPPLGKMLACFELGTAVVIQVV